MATPKKPAYRFPRNQCIACNKDILDKYHPLMLFGKHAEAEKIRQKFEKITGLRLNVDDYFPKKICLRCKVKLDSAVGFEEMCAESRAIQEEMLSREKRVRKCEESISPLPKRTTGVVSQAIQREGQNARKSLLSRYREILPKPVAATREPVTQNDTEAKEPEEPHFLCQCGPQNPKLLEGQDFPLKESHLQKISNACNTISLPKDFATVIVSIPPLKNALKLIYLKELEEQSKGFCKKKQDPSILRVGSKCYQELLSFGWAKLLTEWQEKAPDVLDALTSIAVPENSLARSPQRADAIVPRLCMSFSTLLNTRNAELSLVQKMVTVLVGIGGCSKMTFQRLNKLGICQSSDSWLRIMDDIGANLGSIIKESLDEGLQPRVVYDNFDFRVTPGLLTKDHKNKDNHWISQYVTFDRVDTTSLDNSRPIGDLNEFEMFNYLLNDAEKDKLRSDYTVLATRTLVKFIPWLKPLEDCVGHIKHSCSMEMAKKSVVVALPVVPYNQNKHADVIKYLEWLQDFFKGIVKESQQGQQDDMEQQNSSVESDSEEHLIQIPIGGDLLGRERITGAKRLRRGCDKVSERFDNMSEVAEFWHAKQAFLSLIWEHLYKVESGRDVGTLFYFRNLFGRINVKNKIKNCFAPAENLFLQVFRAYLVDAFMQWSGMTGMESLPVNVKLPPDVKSSQKDKVQYLHDVIGSFVDSFCLILPDVKNAIEKQREQQQEAMASNTGQRASVNDNVPTQSSIPSGSIVFLLKGSKETGFSFQGLGTCIQASLTIGCIIVKVVKVLDNTATLPNSNHPLQEGQAVNWPQNLIALYKAPAVQENITDTCADSNEKGQDDHLNNYGLWITQMGMLLLQLNDTDKEGDGERCMINSKLLLLMFRTTTHSKKYAFEMLRLISKVKCQFTEKMAARTIHGRFVNWKGGEGKNVANDLEEEHFVQFDKKLLNGMGAQKTYKAVERATKASCGLKKIQENFDEKTGVHPPSTTHSYVNADKDQTDMISIVHDLKPFKKVPGRCHATFPHLPRSPLDCMDIRILEDWMKTNKQKLSQDPDAPWSDGEPSSDESDDEDT